MPSICVVIRLFSMKTDSEERRKGKGGHCPNLGGKEFSKYPHGEERKIEVEMRC